jgi:hypothetical protein
MPVPIRVFFNFSRDGILGHKFNKRLESFGACYSQPLLLGDFKANHTLLWFSKSLQKMYETRKLEFILNSIL